MPYPAYMEESIRKVEASRERRLKEEVRRIPVGERMPVLQEYHPDSIEAGMRKLLVGPNKGDRTPNELADLLEGNSRINPDKIDLTKIDYDVDVLVIGGGGAGASAALLAQENGANVLLVTKLRLGDANTVAYQGGTQAADRPDDSPVLHYLDTVGGARFTNDPKLVEALVKDAPDAIRWLESLGVNWDKKPDGSMAEVALAGECVPRCHCARDYTGVEVMRVLRDELRCRQINYVEFAPAIELVMDNKGQVAGAVLVNLETNELSLVRAKAVVMATGGIGRLHIQGYPTTNHYGATADGLVLAYRIGAPLVDIDTMQYHPTCVAYPLAILGLLVTEKVRGLGAQVVNIDGEQFAHPLEPRDVLAACIIQECRRGKGIATPTGEVGVWLDSPRIEMIHGEGTIARELPAMVRQFGRFDINITKQPMLIYPGLHYQNGGIKFSPDGSTSIPGLFAAGEVEGGVHGKNRLGGNSTLDLWVFGRRAGISAAQYAKKVKPSTMTLEHVSRWQRELEQAGLAKVRPISPMLLPNYARQPSDYLADYVTEKLLPGQIKVS
jgi:succinate dehydrogenase/fumarate reductase flavoprotein subunit